MKALKVVSVLALILAPVGLAVLFSLAFMSVGARPVMAASILCLAGNLLGAALGGTWHRIAAATPGREGRFIRKLAVSCLGFSLVGALVSLLLLLQLVLGNTWVDIWGVGCLVLFGGTYTLLMMVDLGRATAAADELLPHVVWEGDTFLPVEEEVDEEWDCVDPEKTLGNLLTLMRGVRERQPRLR